MSAGRPPTRAILTRHFFTGFFRLGFLDDAGEESFKRALLGLLAGITASGLLLARIYMRRYSALSSEPGPALYRYMLPADELLMICLPMFVVGLVMALVSHSLFPDETDFRILMPLPVSRRSVFAAKLTALFLFAAIFIVVSNVAVGVPFALASGGQWAEHTLGMRTLAQVLAGMSGSVCAAAGVIAIQGTIVAISPRAWLARVSTITQTALICGLVLSLPVIVRIPTFAAYLAARPGPLAVAPPVWFLGVKPLVLGNDDPYVVRLGLAAIAGTSTLLAAGAGCYLIRYRRFDHRVLRPERRRQPWTWNLRVPSPRTHHPAYTGVRTFTSATLRRSGLHQLVAWGMFAAGSALAANSLLGSAGLNARWVVAAARGTPLMLMAAATAGLRASLLLPSDIGSAWIFRLAETPSNRRHQLDAARDTLLAGGVMWPIALAFPLEAAVIGLGTALACAPVLVLVGWVLVEVVTAHWRRIPFTCTVLFGKRPAAYTLVLVVIGFNAFVLAGTLVQQLATSTPAAWCLVVLTLLAIGGGLRAVRLQTWGRLPFEFEDYPPDRLDTLRLQ